MSNYCLIPGVGKSPLPLFVKGGFKVPLWKRGI
jgi:hypothetical protein